MIINEDYYILLDTETVSNSETFNYYNNIIFDLGFILVNNNRKIIYKYNKVIKEIFQNENYMKNYVFDKSKLQWYNKNVQIDNFKNIINEIKDIFIRAKGIIAYNINFDLQALKNTFNYFKEYNFLDNLQLEIIDIYHMACQALQDNDNYIVFCVENGKISQKGNINSNAEAVYGFIKSNADFIESHTALDDCMIEYEIYNWVLDYEKSNNIQLIRRPYNACWRLVQRKK